MERGVDYEKSFKHGLCWLLYLNPDFDQLPKWLQEIVYSEISVSKHNEGSN